MCAAYLNASCRNVGAPTRLLVERPVAQSPPIAIAHICVCYNVRLSLQDDNNSISSPVLAVLMSLACVWPSSSSCSALAKRASKPFAMARPSTTTTIVKTWDARLLRATKLIIIVRHYVSGFAREPGQARHLCLPVSWTLRVGVGAHADNR